MIRLCLYNNRHITTISNSISKSRRWTTTTFNNNNNRFITNHTQSRGYCINNQNQVNVSSSDPLTTSSFTTTRSQTPLTSKDNSNSSTISSLTTKKIDKSQLLTIDLIGYQDRVNFNNEYHLFHLKKDALPIIKDIPNSITGNNNVSLLKVITNRTVNNNNNKDKMKILFGPKPQDIQPPNYTSYSQLYLESVITMFKSPKTFNHALLVLKKLFQIKLDIAQTEYILKELYNRDILTSKILDQFIIYMIDEKKFEPFLRCTEYYQRLGWDAYPDTDIHDRIYQFIMKKKRNHLAKNIFDTTILQGLIERSVVNGTHKWMIENLPQRKWTISVLIAYNEVMDNRHVVARLEESLMRMPHHIAYRVVDEVIGILVQFVEQAGAKALEWYIRRIVLLKATPGMNAIDPFIHQRKLVSTHFWTRLRLEYADKAIMSVVRPDLAELDRSHALVRVISNYTTQYSHMDEQLKSSINSTNISTLVEVLTKFFISCNRLPTNLLVVEATAMIMNVNPEFFTKELLKVMPREYQVLLGTPSTYTADMRINFEDALDRLLKSHIEPFMLYNSEDMWNSAVIELGSQCNQWDWVSKLINRMVDQGITIRAETIKFLTDYMMACESIRSDIINPLYRFQSRMKSQNMRVVNLKLLHLIQQGRLDDALTFFNHYIPSKNPITYKFATRIFILQQQINNNNNNNSLSSNLTKNIISSSIQLGNLEKLLGIYLDYSSTSHSIHGHVINELLTTPIGRDMVAVYLTQQQRAGQLDANNFFTILNQKYPSLQHQLEFLIDTTKSIDRSSHDPLSKKLSTHSFIDSLCVLPYLSRDRFHGVCKPLTQQTIDFLTNLVQHPYHRAEKFLATKDKIFQKDDDLNKLNLN